MHYGSGMPADDRIRDLEVRIAYQDRVIAALDEVVREFAERVARVERELLEMRKAAAEVDLVGPADDPPPHY